MAFTELSLPADIPWKRIGVSADMIDPIGGDLQFPEKWRSSLAVFYHEPSEVPPEYCDRKITYLKIVCTITNFQWNQDYEKREELGDVTVLDRLRDQLEEFYAWQAFHNNVTQSFPCYGALLQIAVFPNPAQGVALHDFPYISGFQPRKREMYESLTQSGEVASQSSNKINVLKGGTSTTTNEAYDLDLGGGGGSAVFGLASWQRGQKQEGTIDKFQNQNQNVSTSDASREKRESHSFSTNVNQLYTLLQGYHLGSNRAIFFMQPRPHIQDAKFTFIRGLRRLEGIQEFFMIVDRPAAVKGICVEAALETAHLLGNRAYFPRIIPVEQLFDSGNLEKTAAALGLDPNSHEYRYGTGLVSNWNNHDPWYRWLAKEYRLGRAPWATIDELTKPPNLVFTWSEFSALVKVTELLEDIGLGDIAAIFEEYETDSGTFLVTGRRLHCCMLSKANDDGKADCERSEPTHLSPYKEPPSIVMESKYGGLSIGVTKSPSFSANALDLNGVVQDLNQKLANSVGSADRRPYGARTFLESEFALEQLARMLRRLNEAEVKDVPIDQLKGLPKGFNYKVSRIKGVKTAGDLGGVTTAAIASSLKLSREEAAKVRSRLLVAALHTLDTSTVRAGYRGPNPLTAAFAEQFPAKRLAELVASAVLPKPKR